MNKKIWIFIIALALALTTFSVAKATLVEATTVFTICHHTPANNVTHTFQNIQSYLGHLGTPHSGSTYDTNGACVEITPTPTPTVSPTPSPSPTPEVTPTPTPEVTPTPTPDPCEEELELKLLVVDEVQEPCPTPTPEPTPTPVPEEPKQTSTPSAPVCSDGNTNGAVANPHVYRSGTTATVNWFNTDGDTANIYYKVVDQSDWQYSVLDVKVNADKFGTVTITDLDPNLGYTFSIQQKTGCGGGQLMSAVIVDGPEPQLFFVSYWE